MSQRLYQELLARLHDAYFVFSILRALDQLDDLKSEVPLLGRPRTLDYTSAERAELAEDRRSAQEVARLLVGQLEGMPIWGHPRTRIKVVSPPSIPSVIGSLLPAIYNRTWSPTTRRTASCRPRQRSRRWCPGSSATTRRGRPACSRSAGPAPCYKARSSASVLVGSR